MKIEIEVPDLMHAGVDYPGLFISFEGPEGCGKTTQVNKLIDTLRHIQLPVMDFTKEPGAELYKNKVR